jgi:hypothetical protein
MPASALMNEAERRGAHPIASQGVVVARGVVVTAPPPGADAAGTTGRLAQHVANAFRRHPHLNNVLTHLCGSDRSRLDTALGAILDPAASPRTLSPLALNLLELLCAERGVTGRIMKPYFHELLATRLAPAEAAAVTERIDALAQRVQHWRRI